MNNGSAAAGVSFTGLCMLWGLVTQCLSWAGVLQWPWYAIWGPFLFTLALWVLCIIIAILIAFVFRR